MDQGLFYVLNFLHCSAAPYVSRLQQTELTDIMEKLFFSSETHMARAMQKYVFGSLILAVSGSRTCLHSAPSGVFVASMRIHDTADRKTL